MANPKIGDLWRHPEIESRVFFELDKTILWYGQIKKVTIDWKQSSAVLSGSGYFGCVFNRIQVAREDVLKLLPKGYEVPMPSEAPAASTSSAVTEPHPGGKPTSL